MRPRTLCAQQALRRVAGGVLDDGEEQVLCRYVFVAHPLRERVGVREDAARVVAKGQLGAAAHLRQLRQLLADSGGHGGRVLADALDHRRYHAIGLVEQGEQEVQRGQLGVALALGQLLGGG